MVYSSAVCGALSFMTTNQIRLSIFSMPCDCWKDLMKAIFGFPATVSEIDDDVEICSEFHIPAPFRLLFLSWSLPGRMEEEKEKGERKKTYDLWNKWNLSLHFFKWSLSFAI